MCVLFPVDLCGFHVFSTDIKSLILDLHSFKLKLSKIPRETDFEISKRASIKSRTFIFAVRLLTFILRYETEISQKLALKNSIIGNFFFHFAH